MTGAPGFLRAPAPAGPAQAGATEAVSCRACRGTRGDLVLDLGEQPPCDCFPPATNPGPDPVYPLQMWLCSSCGLAQLVVDPMLTEEARGQEPEALVAQAADAIDRVASAGWLPEGTSVAECASPHGGSWLPRLSERGLRPVPPGEPADVVFDCFGLMHAPDQTSALAERAARVGPGGVMFLQYHPLDTIIRLGQWNSLRHGHFAYYSTTALVTMLAAQGFSPRTAWRFDLYGGTILLAATRDVDVPPQPDGSLETLLAEDRRIGVRHAAVVRSLGDMVYRSIHRVRHFLLDESRAGRTVLGYGAASRAVALLVGAGADRELLQGVVDASPAKQGLRMPGTDIPILGVGELADRRPESVLLFVPDLLSEVRAAFPGVEDSGGHWIDPDAIDTQIR